MPTLMLSIGVLVLLSVGLIVAVNWVTGRAIVQEFATRLIARGLSIQEMALRRHLDAAVDQATFIADAIRDGRYKLFDPALDDFISGTLAAARPARRFNWTIRTSQETASLRRLPKKSGSAKTPIGDRRSIARGHRRLL